MTGPGGWVLGIDPGAVHSGMVLCRIEDTLDRGGVPELEPVDGLTIHRLPAEDPVRVAGQGLYAARVAQEILGLLDLHAVPEDQVTLVCIEGYTTPSGWVSHQAMVDSLHLCRVLGYLEAVWPEHALVAPAGTWPSGKTGWDADPEPVPECLTGRRPSAWSQGAGSRGTHQRSAFCMARSGWRKWHAQGGSAPAATAESMTAPAPHPVATPAPHTGRPRRHAGPGWRHHEHWCAPRRRRPDLAGWHQLRPNLAGRRRGDGAASRERPGPTARPADGPSG